MSTNTLVFALLGLAFAAVGVHLFFYARRVSRRIRQFAEARGLAYASSDDALEADVNETFELPESGLVRSFSRVRDVVRLGRGRLFRAVELLDLVPYASASNPHAARVAVTFELARAPEGIFGVSPSLDVRQRYPLDGPDRTGQVAAMFGVAGLEPPPHPLALSFKSGRALAYLEPPVTGSVSERDLDYLSGLAEGAARLS